MTDFWRALGFILLVGYCSVAAVIFLVGILLALGWPAWLLLYWGIS